MTTMRQRLAFLLVGFLNDWSLGAHHEPSGLDGGAFAAAFGGRHGFSAHGRQGLHLHEPSLFLCNHLLDFHNSNLKSENLVVACRL